MQKKLLITGASGFLGQNLAKALIKYHPDAALFNYSRSLAPTIPTIQGDILNREKVFQAVEGCSAVFHTAAKVGMWGKKTDFEQINIQGTKNVIDACIHHKVPKLIYTSSPSVVFSSRDLEGVDESIAYPEEKDYLGHYPRTKAIAEKMVLAANGPTLHTVALRPHLIWGKGDPHLIPRLVATHRQGRLKRIGDGHNRVDIIHVQNAAYAHVLAYEKMAPHAKVNGQVYFIGQKETVNLWDFINKVMEQFKLPPVKKNISPGIAYTLGALMENVYSLLSIYHRDPPMTRFVALQLCKSHYFNHQKGLSDLGDYQLVSTSLGLSEL